MVGHTECRFITACIARLPTSPQSQVQSTLIGPLQGDLSEYDYGFRCISGRDDLLGIPMRS
jgi:hypothetical protein